MPKGIKEAAKKKQFVRKIIIDPNELMNSSSLFDGLREDFKYVESTGHWETCEEWKAPDDFVNIIEENDNVKPNELNRLGQKSQFFKQSLNEKNTVLSKKNESFLVKNEQSDNQEKTYKDIEQEIKNVTSNTITEEHIKFIVALYVQATPYLRRNAKTFGFRFLLNSVIKAGYDTNLFKLIGDKMLVLGQNTEAEDYLDVTENGVLCSLKQPVVLEGNKANKIAVFTFKYILDKDKKIKILPAEIEFDVAEVQLKIDEIVIENKNIQVDLIAEDDAEIIKKNKIEETIKAGISEREFLKKFFKENKNELKDITHHLNFLLQKTMFLSDERKGFSNKLEKYKKATEILKNTNKLLIALVSKQPEKFQEEYQKYIDLSKIYETDSIIKKMKEAAKFVDLKNQLQLKIEQLFNKTLKTPEKFQHLKKLIISTGLGKFLSDQDLKYLQQEAAQDLVKEVSVFVREKGENIENIKQANGILVNLNAILNEKITHEKKAESINSFIVLAQSCKGNELTGYMLKISAILFIGVGVSLMIAGALTFSTIFDPVTFLLGFICLSIGMSMYFAAMAAHTAARVGNRDFLSSDSMSFLCETNNVASSMGFFASTTTAIEAKKQSTAKQNSEAGTQEYTQIPSEDEVLKIEEQEGLSTYNLHNK